MLAVESGLHTAAKRPRKPALRPPPADDVPTAGAAKRRRGSVSFKDDGVVPPTLPPRGTEVAHGWGVAAFPPRSTTETASGPPMWEFVSEVQTPVSFSGIARVCKELCRRPDKDVIAKKHAAERLWSTRVAWNMPAGMKLGGPARFAGQMALASASTRLLSERCGGSKFRARGRTPAATMAGASGGRGGSSSGAPDAPGIATGWARLHTLKRWIETCYREYGTAQTGRPWRQPYMQKLGLKMFMEADARNMFGPDLNRVLTRLQSEFNMNASHHLVALAAPRRHGKSQVVAIYTVASLLTFRNRRILVTAYREKQVKTLHKTILAVLNSIKHLIPGLKKISDSKTDGILTLTFSDTDERVVTFGAVTPALRGQGAHLVIVDEIAQVPITPFLQVIVPLLRAEGTCMVALSTVTDESNSFSQMMELEDRSGRKIFRVLQIETVCDECKGLGFDDSICPHNTSKHPHYLDASKDDLVKVFYDKMGDKEDFRAEIQGIIKTSKSVFIPAHINALFTRPPFDTRTLLPGALRKYIFLAVDPCGCGADSNMAAVSAYCTMADHVVRFPLVCTVACGLCACVTTPWRPRPLRPRTARPCRSAR